MAIGEKKGRTCIDPWMHASSTTLNVCPKYTDTNFSNHDDRIPFESVFSDVIPTLKEILPRINQVWDLKCGHGSMK